MGACALGLRVSRTGASQQDPGSETSPGTPPTHELYLGEATELAELYLLSTPAAKIDDMTPASFALNLLTLLATPVIVASSLAGGPR